MNARRDAFLFAGGSFQKGGRVSTTDWEDHGTGEILSQSQSVKAWRFRGEPKNSRNSLVYYFSKHWPLLTTSIVIADWSRILNTQEVQCSVTANSFLFSRLTVLVSLYFTLKLNWDLSDVRYKYVRTTRFLFCSKCFIPYTTVKIQNSVYS